MSRIDRAINIDDLKRIAKRRLPKIMFDFIEGGVEDEVGLRTNANAFRDLRLVPRYYVDTSKREQRATLFDRSYASPFGIAPTGMAGAFRRDADDIYITVPITPTEAALGAKIEVPTIDGRTQMRVPPGTQSGQKLRLREKGVPSATRDGARGDEIVETKIVVPAVQDERSKELLRELAKLNPQDPRADLWSKV